jgi:hypothetical protein
VRPRGPVRGFMVTLSEDKSAITTASHVHRETKKAVPPDRNQAGGALQLFFETTFEKGNQITNAANMMMPWWSRLADSRSAPGSA